MKQKRYLIVSFILGGLLASMLFLCVFFSQIFKRFSDVSDTDRETRESIKFQNQQYYDQLSFSLSQNRNADSDTVSSYLQPYIPRMFVQTDYSESDKECTVFMDFYFAEEDYDNWLKYKERLFIAVDPRILWTNDTLCIQLWTQKDNSFFMNRELETNAESFTCFSVFLSQIKKEDFPCHIQMKLSAPWSSDKKPENVVYEYYWE